MAEYRLIWRKASTGKRTSSLSHLGFRVWIQYQLTADDFGVCPATASKLQGDNEMLEQEPAKRIQAEIERLIAIDLCRVFTDGPRRYLYQPDWQDWQRIRYPAATSMPCIPAELLRECSSETQELVRNNYDRASGKLSPRGRACDAPATADADAVPPEGGPGETALTVERQPPRTPRGRPGLLQTPGAWGINHAQCVSGFCDFVCLRQQVFDEFVTRTVSSGVTEAEARHLVAVWAADVRARWTGRVPGSDIWAFWRHEWESTHGSNRPAAATSRAQLDPAAGVREALRRG